jgi:hypothetical protein
MYMVADTVVMIHTGISIHDHIVTDHRAGVHHGTGTAHDTYAETHVSGDNRARVECVHNPFSLRT